MSLSWGPTNETAGGVFEERTVLDGFTLGFVGYGIHIALFVSCLDLIVSRRKKERKDWILLAYICLLFIFGTVGNALNAKWAEMIFVGDINFPGGPNAFNVDGSGLPVPLAGNTVYILNLLFADGLLLYRFWLIYSKSVYVVVLPSCIFIANIVLSIMLVTSLSHSNSTLWSALSAKLAIAYWSMSIANNAVLTIGIAGRLMLWRWRCHRILGATSTPYLTISAMMVESALLYTINGLIFIISFGINSPVQNLAVCILGQTQSIAPLLIILRVAQGKGWSEKTADSFIATHSAPTIQFRPHEPSTGALYNGSAMMLSTVQISQGQEGKGDTTVDFTPICKTERESPV